MITATKFWDRNAEKYSRSPIRDMKAYEAALNRTRSHLSPEDRVLELGSGTGATARLLAPFVRHITASDLSPGMTNIAVRKAREEGIENITCVAAPVDDPSLQGKGFDTVLAHNLLHLVRDLDASLASTHQMLRPGGLFVSKTPCLADASFGVRLMIRVLVPVMQLVGKAPFVASFTASHFDDALRRAGFEIVETGAYPDHGRGHYVVARKT